MSKSTLIVISVLGAAALAAALYIADSPDQLDSGIAISSSADVLASGDKTSGPTIGDPPGYGTPAISFDQPSPSPESFSEALNKGKLGAFADAMLRKLDSDPDAGYYLALALQHCAAVKSAYPSYSEIVKTDQTVAETGNGNSEGDKFTSKAFLEYEDCRSFEMGVLDGETLLLSAARNGSNVAKAHLALNQIDGVGDSNEVDASEMLSEALKSADPEVYLLLSDWSSATLDGEPMQHRQFAWAKLAELSGADLSNSWRSRMLCEPYRTCDPERAFVDLLREHLLDDNEIQKGEELFDRLVRLVRAGEYDSVVDMIENSRD